MNRDRAEEINKLERLKELVEKKAVLRGRFILSSGATSSYYFDGRRVTHDAEGVRLVGELVLNSIASAGVKAIGGPATGANPMITATQIAALGQGIVLDGFFVRSDKKKHGAERRIEGNLPTTPGAKVAIVDDTITSGGSIKDAIEVVEAEGFKVERVVVLVDRQQGGAERLRDGGYEVTALLQAQDDRILAPRDTSGR